MFFLVRHLHQQPATSHIFLFQNITSTIIALNHNQIIIQLLMGDCPGSTLIVDAPLKIS